MGNFCRGLVEYIGTWDSPYFRRLRCALTCTTCYDLMSPKLARLYILVMHIFRQVETGKQPSICCSTSSELWHRQSKQVPTSEASSRAYNGWHSCACDSLSLTHTHMLHDFAVHLDIPGHWPEVHWTLICSLNTYTFTLKHTHSHLYAYTNIHTYISIHTLAPHINH